MRIDKKSILISLVIGDGTILKDKRCKSCTLEIVHCEKQLDYLTYKVNLLTQLTGKKISIKKKIFPPVQIKTNKNITPERIGYRFSFTHDYYRVLRKWIYPEGKKKYSLKFLNKLNEQGLAIWYMDDGSLYLDKRGKEGAVNACQLELHTYANLEETNILCDYFLNTWNIRFSKRLKPNGLYTLRCRTKEARKFKQLVAPYIIESMYYKIDFE